MQMKPRRTASLVAAFSLLAQLVWPCAGLAADAPEPAGAPDAAYTVGAVVDAAASIENAAPDSEAEESAETPIFGPVSWSVPNEKGLTIAVSAPDPQPGLAEADAFVWTKAGGADAVRINARLDGSIWRADLDIARFHYQTGTYYVQMVGRDGSGVPAAASEVCAIELEPAQTAFTARRADAVGARWRLTLSSPVLPGHPDVWFEVRSAAGETLCVLPAERTEEAYTALLPLADLGAAGTLTVAACCGHEGECGQEIAEAAIEAERLTYAGLSLTADSTRGTFSFTLSTQSPLGIQGARIAIWSDDAQSDIVWTDMAPAAGGYTSPTLSVRDFSGFGTYRAHAYVKLGGGSDVLAAALETAIVPRDFIWTQREAAGRYSILIDGPSSRRDLRVAVWSERGGQDDLVWYPAAALGGGTWKADVRSANHADGGTWHAHVYSGDTLLGGTSFTVADSELMSEAERRIAAGCEKVYAAVGTDLHAVYLWVVNNLSYVRRSGHLSPPAGYSREQWYAVEGFEKQTGNCYTYASTFCQLARGLGYSARYVEGDVYGVGQKWWPHGFVLITIDGSTYICDPELQYASSAGRNLYMQPISSPRATYRW